MQPAIRASAIMHFVIFMMWQKFKKKKRQPLQGFEPGPLAWYLKTLTTELADFLCGTLIWYIYIITSYNQAGYSTIECYKPSKCAPRTRSLLALWLESPTLTWGSRVQIQVLAEQRFFSVKMLFTVHIVNITKCPIAEAQIAGCIS